MFAKQRYFYEFCSKLKLHKLFFFLLLMIDKNLLPNISCIFVTMQIRHKARSWFETNEPVLINLWVSLLLNDSLFFHPSDLNANSTVFAHKVP